VGLDAPSDLAVLKISASGLSTLPLGDSDKVRVGDVCLAVGNPLGIGETVTNGIISAKGRATETGTGSFQDFLQTDAPINHGNSGGALVNTKGEVVGINAAMLSPVDANIGIGFAIPSNMARHVMDDLRKDGHVRRAQLGVEVQPVTSDLADSLGLKHVGGAIIGKVTPDSAADRAGLKRGDVIESFNGQAVTDIMSGLSYGPKAKDAINKAVEKAPKSSAMYVARGVGNYYLPAQLGGGTQPAIADFRKAISMDPKNAEAYLWLGISLRKENKDAEARQAFAKSLELNPNRVWTKQQLEKTPAK